ncbi:MAG TPA: recombinase RecT [Hyphomicrobiaceae bacterium]|jgi:recombination protein RecT
MADGTQTALVPYEAFKSELVARQDEIAALLPSTISREAFVNTAIVAVKSNPALLECDRRSLHKAVTAAAMDGMRPDGREGVIIPQKEDGRLTARWQPMAFGIRKRARELDGIIVDAQVVYEHDHFRRTQGDDARIEHEPAPLGTDRGRPVGAYAIFKKGAEILHREVMDEKQIAAVRAISKQPNGLMWAKFTDEAWRKTVVRRGAKTVPCSDALRTVLGRDDDLYDVGRDITPPAPQLAPVRGPAIPVTWRAGEALEHVPVREFKERATAFIRSQEPAAVTDWAKHNALGLREFWGLDKDAALALKGEIEKAVARQKAMPLVEEPSAPASAEPAGEAALFAQDAPEPDDREIVMRDLLAALGKEPDPKKRVAIWADSEQARQALTDEQVARLKAALDQMELQAGKPRGRAAA